MDRGGFRGDLHPASEVARHRRLCLKVFACNGLLALASPVLAPGALKIVVGRFEPMPEAARLRILWRRMAQADTTSIRAGLILGFIRRLDTPIIGKD